MQAFNIGTVGLITLLIVLLLDSYPQPLPHPLQT